MRKSILTLLTLELIFQRLTSSHICHGFFLTATGWRWQYKSSLVQSLQCARRYSHRFPWLRMISNFGPQNIPAKWVLLLLPAYRWGNWGTQIELMTKFIRLLRGRTSRCSSRVYIFSYFACLLQLSKIIDQTIPLNYGLTQCNFIRFWFSWLK